MDHVKVAEAIRSKQLVVVETVVPSDTQFTDAVAMNAYISGAQDDEDGDKDAQDDEGDDRDAQDEEDEDDEDDEDDDDVVIVKVVAGNLGELADVYDNMLSAQPGQQQDQQQQRQQGQQLQDQQDQHGQERQDQQQLVTQQCMLHLRNAVHMWGGSDNRRSSGIGQLGASVDDTDKALRMMLMIKQLDAVNQRRAAESLPAIMGPWSLVPMEGDSERIISGKRAARAALYLATAITTRVTLVVHKAGTTDPRQMAEAMLSSQDVQRDITSLVYDIATLQTYVR